MKHRNIVRKYVESASECGIYTAIPDISDRKSWEEIPEEYKKLLVEQGERASKEPWTALLISDFREFKKNGNRVRFEDKNFPRRRKLGKLVIAECVENKGRFIDDILDGFYLILEETTWCLPPHTSYERDKEQEALPDVTRPIIDLFDAESGAFVAFTEYLLRPVFKEISPYISGYVNEKLKERIFTPYENQHFWWMGNGDEPMCNWTVWCTQNVLLCALTREKSFFSNEKRLEYVKKAATSCDLFLKDYGDDGACSEGAQYYSHAGLCLYGCLEILRGVLKSSNSADEGKTADFEEIFKEELIRNIATYISKVHACGDYYVNFADCSALAGNRTAREFLFGKLVGDEALMALSATDVIRDMDDGVAIDEEINLFYRALQAFAIRDILEFRGNVKTSEDVFFDSIGLMVSRDNTFVLAVKAGNNGDSHNHNDVGSFTLYKDGKPFIIDLGVGTYTAKTFSDRRYDIWTMQSQFHNLPTFIDMGQNASLIMQRDGAGFGAKNVNCILNKSSLSMDISGAYDDERIQSYTREVSLIKGKGVRVADEYVGGPKGFLSLMTYEKPIIVNEDNVGREIRIKVGDLGFIKAVGATKAQIQEYPIEDERLAIAWKHEVYRIVLNLEECSGEKNSRISLEIG